MAGRAAGSSVRIHANECGRPNVAGVAGPMLVVPAARWASRRVALCRERSEVCGVVPSKVKARNAAAAEPFVLPHRQSAGGLCCHRLDCLSPTSPPRTTRWLTRSHSALSAGSPVPTTVFWLLWLLYNDRRCFSPYPPPTRWRGSAPTGDEDSFHWVEKLGVSSRDTRQ